MDADAQKTRRRLGSDMNSCALSWFDGTWTWDSVKFCLLLNRTACQEWTTTALSVSKLSLRAVSPCLSSWCYPWLQASETITFWWSLFLSSPEVLANLMLWWGRSLALIQIMFQSLLEDLKPYPGSLEDGGNEACWDFNHFYICWKIRRKEEKKTEKKEKTQPPHPVFTLLEKKIICFEDWYNEKNI